MFFLPVIHQSYYYLQFYSYTMKLNHIVSLTMRDLPTFNLNLFTYLISFTVRSHSATSVAPFPTNKFCLSFEDLSCGSLLILLGFLHCIAWCIFLWVPPPPARALTPMVGPLPYKVLLNKLPFHSLGSDSSPHCSLQATTDTALFCMGSYTPC